MPSSPDELAEVSRYEYYQFSLGGNIMRRDGLHYELLSKTGEWEERRDLIRKFVGGDCDFDAISEKEAMKIVKKRKPGIKWKFWERG